MAQAEHVEEDDSSVTEGQNTKVTVGFGGVNVSDLL